MTSVYLADAKLDELSALRLMLRDLNLNVVGEANNWATLLNQVTASNPDMVLVDWSVIENDCEMSLNNLRSRCPATSTIVLVSEWDAREQAARSTGADLFISKCDSTGYVKDHLKAAAENAQNKKVFGT